MSYDNDRLWALLIGVLLVVTPFFLEAPLPITILTLLLALWTATIILKKTAPPGKWKRLSLLCVVMVVIIFSYGTLLGRDAGTGFLMLLSFLKLFEIKTKRDVFIVVFLGYFLIASNFFHTQSPWIAIYVVTIVIYLTSVLIYFSDNTGSIIFQQRLKISGRMFLQAIPFMLILFILFPRIPGPLWGLPKDATTAVTGLSEDMSPGSLSNLIESEEVAFRVRFDGDIPSHDQLYWRGPVFSRYDGQTWTAANTEWLALNLVTDATASEDRRIQYTVTLEPHQRNWLFALEYPVDLQGTRYKITREGQLLNNKKILSVMQYSLVSDTDTRNHSLFAHERRRNLKLPDSLNPKTIELAEQWKNQANDNARLIVQQALDYFTREPFIYTLNPPLLGNDAMDDFIFETRRGFCEHYSSAFVYLMRAAGIPARVVTGYQGGEKNPVDDYLIVRQSSAHAWAEVWYDDVGWARIDPVAAVSPDRIERGIQDAVSEKDQLPAILLSENNLLLTMRYQWDSFNQRWNEWVIGFDQHKQRELFTLLGFKEAGWQDMVVWLAGLMLVAGSIVAWWVFKQGSGHRIDRLRHIYDIFCKKLARTGRVRRSSEGPQEYSARIKKVLSPGSGKTAENITQLYLLLRYGSQQSSQSEKQLSKMVNRFQART